MEYLRSMMEVKKENEQMEMTTKHLEEETVSDMERVTLRQPSKPTEYRGENQGLSKENTCHSLRERKHHSEPVSPEQLKGRNRFERQRIWSQTKQESFEVPEEFKCQTEDNVFSDAQSKTGRIVIQRCLSVPSKLPDVVPEPLTDSGKNSPDVLSNSDVEDHACQPQVKSILSSRQTSKDAEMKDDLERKEGFEGPVCYDLGNPPLEVKRKKSVSFETAATIVRVISESGKKARSHFRSSGYGSQSDCSQHSTTSNVSSEQGSVMSDDVIEEKRSFETDDGKPSSEDGYSVTSTGMDGSLDGSDDEPGAEELCPKQTNPTVTEREKYQHFSEEAKCCCQVVRVQGEYPQSSEEVKCFRKAAREREEVDIEMEQWKKLMSPKFHCQYEYEEADLPALSIFENQNGSVCISGIAGDDFSYLRNQVLDPEACDPVDVQRSDIPLPLQPFMNITGSENGADTGDTENSENKTSPTTKEECQRELFKRLFEERMLKYDPAKESLSDLLDWFKNNIGDALTPSPKSPFFLQEDQGQQQRSRAQQAVSPPQGLGLTVGPDLNMLLAHGGKVVCNLVGHPPASGLPWGPLSHQQGAVVRPTLQGPLSDGRAQQYQQNNMNRGFQVQCDPHSPNDTHQYLCNIYGAQPDPVPQRCANARQGLPSNVSQYHHVPPSTVSVMQSQQSAACSKTTGVQLGPYSQSGDHHGQCIRPASKMQALPSTLEQCRAIIPTVVDEVAQMQSYTSSVNISSSESSVRSDYSLLEQFVVFAQCNDSMCKEPQCEQKRNSLHSVKEALKIGRCDLSQDDRRFIGQLQEHYRSCDQPNCNLPWCRYITLHRCQGGGQKMQPDLMTLLSNPVHTLLPAGVNYNHFVQLNSGLNLQGMPQEWKDWMLLSPLSHSFSVGRVVVPEMMMWPRRQWAIKMTSLHDGGNQLEVLQKLRDLCNPHIIEHNWAAASDSSGLLVVCTDFLPGLSLRDLLDQRGPLCFTQARRYLQQILQAVSFMHQRNIIYLNWACSNLLLDLQCRMLKMSNFTMSVSLPGDRADIGMVKLSLPADVVPTELLSIDGMVTARSDSWGIACVLHEMLAGVRPWYQLRHHRQEDIWRKILEQIPPVLSEVLSQTVRRLMQECLQRDPSMRLSVEEIEDYLSST